MMLPANQDLLILGQPSEMLEPWPPDVAV